MLDAWYRWLGWGEFGDDDCPTDEIEVHSGMRDATDDVRSVTIRPVRITIDVDAPPASPSDAYLRLHLLSHRLAAPRTLNLDGIFGVLNNVVWTDLGPGRRRRHRRRPAARCGWPAARSPCTASTSSRG